MKFTPLSKSRIDRSYCPWTFAQEYIRRGIAKGGVVPEGIKYELVEDPAGDSKLNLLFGNVIHDIFEKMLQKPDLDWKAMVPTEIACSEHPMYNMEWVFRIVEIFLDKFTYTDDIYGLEEHIAVDHDLNACDYNDPNALVRAKIDQLKLDPERKWAKIIDYKTQPNIMEAADNYQIKLYAWLFWKNFPEYEVVETELYFARYGAFRSAEFSRDELDWIEYYVKENNSRIHNIKDFTVAERCGYCDLCPYSSTFCPKLKEERDMGMLVPKSVEESVKLLGKIVGAEKQVKEMKDIMKGWVKKEGPVKLQDGVTMGFKYSESSEYDPSVIVNLVERGEIGKNSLKADTKQIDKVMFVLNKKIEEGDQSVLPLLEALTQARKLKGKTRFAAYKGALK